jgi:hypothetical protein
MAERDIDCRAWAKRERHTNQFTLHRVRRRDLGPEGDMTLLPRRVEQRGEPLRVGHRLVFAAVEGKRSKLGSALFGETQGRTFGNLLPRRRRRSAGESAPERMTVPDLRAGVFAGAATTL